MSKRTPEYESLRTQLHGICSSLSSQPATIVPLVTDLAGIKIISQSTMNALVGVRGIPPFEQAAQLLSSVHISVQFDVKKLYIFADKLIDHGHKGIAIELLKECGMFIRVCGVGVVTGNTLIIPAGRQWLS